MSRKYDNSLYFVSIMIILFGIFISAIGLFYTTGGQPFDILKQFGDTVTIFGDGLYANDALFYAAIFKGSDLTILFIAVPLLITALILDAKKKTL